MQEPRTSRGGERRARASGEQGRPCLSLAPKQGFDILMWRHLFSFQDCPHFSPLLSSVHPLDFKPWGSSSDVLPFLVALCLSERRWELCLLIALHGKLRYSLPGRMHAAAAVNACESLCAPRWGCWVPAFQDCVRPKRKKGEGGRKAGETPQKLREGEKGSMGKWLRGRRWKAGGKQGRGKGGTSSILLALST